MCTWLVMHLEWQRKIVFLNPSKLRRELLAYQIHHKHMRQRAGGIVAPLTLENFLNQPHLDKLDCP